MRTADVQLQLLARFPEAVACAVRVDRRVATFDLDSACWQQLLRAMRERRPPPLPIGC